VTCEYFLLTEVYHDSQRKEEAVPAVGAIVQILSFFSFSQGVNHARFRFMKIPCMQEAGRGSYFIEDVTEQRMWKDRFLLF